MAEALWNRCLDYLQDELPSQQFNTWIRPLQVEENGVGILLRAPNRFVKDWVKDKFANRIQSLLEELNGGQVLSFELDINAGSSKPAFVAPPPAPEKPVETVKEVVDVADSPAPVVKAPIKEERKVQE